jgi:hypothetical protein
MVPAASVVLIILCKSNSFKQYDHLFYLVLCSKTESLSRDVDAADSSVLGGLLHLNNVVCKRINLAVKMQNLL